MTDGVFCPNRKYNFLKGRIRATSVSAVARGSAQAVFSLLFVMFLLYLAGIFYANVMSIALQ